MCQPHWQQLRAAIGDRGLSHLVAQGGENAARKVELELAERQVTKESFDPLMAAHWAVCGNAMRTLGDAGINPLYLLSSGPAPEGRNDCPLCELNYLHKTSCTDTRCTLDKERGYDWMIDRAADDSLQQARELKLVALPS